LSATNSDLEGLDSVDDNQSNKVIDITIEGENEESNEESDEGSDEEEIKQNEISKVQLK
jgi:hypothetical protein